MDVAMMVLAGLGEAIALAQKAIEALQAKDEATALSLLDASLATMVQRIAVMRTQLAAVKQHGQAALDAKFAAAALVQGHLEQSQAPDAVHEALKVLAGAFTFTAPAVQIDPPPADPSKP
jgi:uncharacterized protein YigA (DUF484 family)